MNKIPSITFWKPKSIYDKFKYCHICRVYNPTEKTLSVAMATITEEFGGKSHYGICGPHEEIIERHVRVLRNANPGVYVTKLSEIFNRKFYYKPMTEEAKRIIYHVPEYQV